jgi:hypothetical protein
MYSRAKKVAFLPTATLAKITRGLWLAPIQRQVLGLGLAGAGLMVGKCGRTASSALV